MPDLGLVSSETNNPLSITFTGLGQSCGRSRIQAGTDLSRMEAPQGDLQGNFYSAGTVQSRPTAESQSRSLCELETRSRSNGNQRLSPQLERPRRLCLSSLLTNRQVPSEGETRTEHNCASGSQWRNQNWYPMLLELMVEFPLLLPDRRDILRDLMNQLNPLVHMPQRAKTSRLESLRQQHSTAGVSKEVSELLLAGWSNGTDLRLRLYTVNGVVFKLASLTKKRQTGAPLKELSFASFTANDRLCVVQCLRQYETVTSQF